MQKEITSLNDMISNICVMNECYQTKPLYDNFVNRYYDILILKKTQFIGERIKKVNNNSVMLFNRVLFVVARDS